MATKTFEELKQLAIQIRDEKTNKQNTATRVGTAMLEYINKLEQDYYDKTQTDEELKERDDKLTEIEEKRIEVLGKLIKGNIDLLKNGYSDGYVDDNGNVVLDSKSFCTIYSIIPVKNGITYTYTLTDGEVAAENVAIVCFFDSTFTPIQSYHAKDLIDDTLSITAPTNSRYCTVCKKNGSTITFKANEDYYAMPYFFSIKNTSIINKLIYTDYPYRNNENNIITTLNPFLSSSVNAELNPNKSIVEKNEVKLTISNGDVSYGWAYYYTLKKGTYDAGKYLAFIKVKRTGTSPIRIQVFGDGGKDIANKDISNLIQNDYNVFSVEFELQEAASIGLGVSSKNTSNVGDEIYISLAGIAKNRNDYNLGSDIYTIDDIINLGSGDGIKLSNVDNTIQGDVSNPLSIVKETAGLSAIFHSIGVIADSLGSGELQFYHDGKFVYPDCYEWSWGQRLAALIGNCKCTNWSSGGLRADTWIANYWNSEKSGFTLDGSESKIKNDKKLAYIIELATNDSISEIPVGDFDTDVDISDYNNNKSTFTGNYAGIIQRVKSIQPSAKIFCITIPEYWSDKAESVGYNDAIRLMASKFSNVFIIDLQKYTPIGSEFENQYKMFGHMTTQGYQYVTYMIATYIDYIIRQNPEKFKKAAVIGTEYDDGNL